MIKRLAVLLAVLALVAAACGGESEDSSTTTEGPTETTATTSAPGGQTGGTLAEVTTRGALRCGVSTTAIGFAEPQDDGSYTGFDADYCRAVAAAVFGDSTAVVFVGLTAAERFTALANGEVDVLFRNTTWTQSRDTEIGGDFGPTTFYDGQQVMGTKELLPNGDDSTLADIDGARLCTNAGTTTEKNITEGAAVVGATISLVTTEDFEQAMGLFRDGSCDLVTTDGSGLFGERFDAVAKGEIADGDWVIFPKAPISKEPLGPMYRQNDSEWADIINWVVYATFIADEKGITRANVADAIASPPDPEAGRLLGVGEDELQTEMGLSADAFANVISQVGNYDDIYVGNLAALGFSRTNSPNDQWFRGGLIYAPPAR